MTLDVIQGDRRSARRYAIGLEAQWELVQRKKVLFSGAARTVDLSSRGLLVATGRKLPVGLKLQLTIFWPVLLHNVTTLQLKIEGRVVRSDYAHAAIRILKHEFRTAGTLREPRCEAMPSARIAVPFRVAGAHPGSIN